MATSPTLSLKEILSQHELKRKDLESECPRDVRNKVAVELADWKMVGNCFNFTRAKLEAIDRENQTEDQRKVALLDAWSEREGMEATYLKLAEVLHQRGRGDLVQMLCIKLKSMIGCASIESNELSVKKDVKNNPARTIDIDGRIKTLENRFDDLHRRIMTEITDNEVSGMEILRTLSKLPINLKKEFESSIQQMLPTLEGKSTDILFLHLGPLFVFIDYGLLDHLISKFGSSALKRDMKSYVSAIQAFMCDTTVADLMDYWPGDEQPHLNYSKLRAKFKDDPKSYTLERLDNFRRKFCSKVRLSELIFRLILLESGESFFATWLVPTAITSELAVLIRQIERSFYEEENVLWVSLDPVYFYQPISKNTIDEEDLVTNTVAPEIQKGDDIDFQEGDPLVPESTRSTVTSLSDCEDTTQDQTEQLKDFSLLPNYMWYEKEKEIAKLKAAVSKKDLEIQMLKTKLEETRGIAQDFSSSMSEKIVTLMHDNSDLESKNKGLEEMRSELQELTVNLLETMSLVEVEEEQAVAEDTTDTPIPIVLEILQEKQQRVTEWLLETATSSESGFAGEGSEPPTEYFEKQFLSDLPMKIEALEEEIASLTVVTGF